jgi:polysaccharide deacetylase 2 family uncharacterized protein YibQ
VKLSLSPSDRFGPSGRSTVGGGGWLSTSVYLIVLPITLVVAAAAVWYIVTGETPLEAMADFTQAPRIVMSMPARPGGERPNASLIQPPAPDRDVKMTMEAVPPAPAVAPAAPADVPNSGTAPLPNASPNKETAASPAAKSPAVPPTVTLPSVSVPAADSATPPPPPAMSEPAIPPGGEPLAPPSFAQLPTRADLKALPTAPANDLLRNSANGPLPVVAGTREARAVYARPFAVEGTPPRIAVVVTGLGLSRESTEAAITKLPPEISLSFSPYAGNLDNWIKRARNNGHEVLIDLPLEPPNFPIHDAGPLAVLSRYGPAEAVAHVDAILAKTTSYVGVAAALRSPVAAKEQWAPILRDLKNRGLLFVGDGLVGAQNADLPASLSVTLVADETPFRVAIDVRLSRLLATAQRDGSALAYVSARPVTFERLLAWVATFPQKGVALAPVSAVVHAAAH